MIRGGEKQQQGMDIHRSVMKKNHSRKKHLRKKKKQDAVKIVEFELASIDRTGPETKNHQPWVPAPAMNSTKTSTKWKRFRIPMMSDHRLCSTRGVVATFVITLILILAAGMAVGIVFASTNSQNRGNSNSNNNNLNSCMIILFLSAMTYVNFRCFLLVPTAATNVLTSSVSIGSQSGSACSGYTTINDPSRNSSLRGSSSACDNGQLFNSSNGGAWIRFIGTGGTIIAQSPPGRGYCGAFLPAWYNTTLPTTVGATVNGTICIVTEAETCASPIDTQVVFCPGNFYVYLLSPVPFCNIRYCTAF